MGPENVDAQAGYRQLYIFESLLPDFKFMAHKLVQPRRLN